MRGDVFDDAHTALPPTIGRVATKEPAGDFNWPVVAAYGVIAVAAVAFLMYALYLKGGSGGLEFGAVYTLGFALLLTADRASGYSRRNRSMT
jgi:hypothetical protein